MDPTESIRKLGFRRWYERQLIGSHAALVTCLLCGIVVAVLMEEIALAEFGVRQLSLLAVDFGALVIGWLSFRQYITMLERAERYGQRSNCPKCDVYGRFKVLDTGMDRVPGAVAAAVAPLDAAWIRVECRMCATTWRIPE